jgi:hypothetical protein
VAPASEASVAQVSVAPASEASVAQVSVAPASEALALEALERVSEEQALAALALGALERALEAPVLAELVLAARVLALQLYSQMEQPRSHIRYTSLGLRWLRCSTHRTRYSRTAPNHSEPCRSAHHSFWARYKKERGCRTCRV